MAGEYTHLRAALEGPVPDLVIAAWQEVASEHVATGEYRNYLTFEKLFPNVGPTALAVHVANTAPYARVLEDGHAAFHLPSQIDWGAAVSKGTAKIAKLTGRRRLTVPFRHYTPGPSSGGLSSARVRSMMSPETYKHALAASRGTAGARERLHAQGTRLSRPYGAMSLAPGLRGREAATLSMLTVRAQRQEGQPGYTWRARTYEGLKRIEQKNPSTGSHSSSWMTFRTLTEDSVGWFIPAFEGYHFAARVADLVRDPIQQLLGVAAQADVVAHISVRVGPQGTP
jgi:hypothetical protein